MHSSELVDLVKKSNAPITLEVQPIYKLVPQDSLMTGIVQFIQSMLEESADDFQYLFTGKDILDCIDDIKDDMGEEFFNLSKDEIDWDEIEKATNMDREKILDMALFHIRNIIELVGESSITTLG
jgi:hypothetical protein